jgi:ribosomal protein L37AE/L43A
MSYRVLVVWKCRACGHTFYRLPENAQKKNWFKRLLSSRDKLKCPVCRKTEAVKISAVTKTERVCTT